MGLRPCLRRRSRCAFTFSRDDFGRFDPGMGNPAYELHVTYVHASGMASLRLFVAVTATGAAIAGGRYALAIAGLSSIALGYRSWLARKAR